MVLLECPDLTRWAVGVERVLYRPLTHSQLHSHALPALVDPVLDDMLRAAEFRHPACDVRPILASRVEFWARWMGGLDSDVRLRERLMFAVDSVEGSAFLDVVAGGTNAVKQRLTRLIRELTEGGLAHQVIMIVPGIYALDVKATGDLFRLDCISGEAIRCPAGRVSYVREQLRRSALSLVH